MGFSPHRNDWRSAVGSKPYVNKYAIGPRLPTLRATPSGYITIIRMRIQYDWVVAIGSTYQSKFFAEQF